ncbi:MJ1255/VC2487 family glycosyltransferase [Marinimicrobium agarilyticum]|uniref:MJ1255/VC2487 family glycosyltransferase n=1 Tax=Marinimicrobium agarilyticum TaxID=306546 RepID=UPI00040FC12F|nr:MJ1255/VC2487 family glycosyltransferase [Marinimicrobium agarilyticum]
MKILYGVQGTGNGHTTRARIMAKALAEQGVEVDWVFSGRAPEDYFDMDIFGDYQCFRGLTFVTTHGRVRYGQTLLSSHLRRLYRDIRSLDVSQYDLLINDFEPVTAWAARRAGLPSIGLSHQCAFLHPIPKRGENLFVRWFMRNFAPVEKAIGLHWHHFNQPILPPLIEPSNYPNECRTNQCLVYLPFAQPEDIVPQLRAFPNTQFYVYQQVPEATDEGHIHIRPFSREGFQADLHRCESVICSAGFELPSEAIQLGKKLLVQPVVGQMEQQSNAFALSQLGYGAVAQVLTEQAIGDWLAMPRPRPVNYPAVAQALAQWLTSGEGEGFDTLRDRLWREVPEPESRLNVEATVSAG